MRPDTLYNALTKDQRDRGYSLVELNDYILAMVRNEKIIYTYTTKNVTVNTVRDDCDNHFLMTDLRYLGGEEKQAL
jgi:hypothetical protein